MRICFIVGAFPSLSETFILNQITGLLDQGHALRIYAGARTREIVVHEEVVRSGLFAQARFYDDKPASFFLRVIQFPFLFLAAALTAPGAVFRSLNVVRYRREAYSLDLFYRTRAFLEVRDYDIILCHFGQNGLIGERMKEIGALRGRLVTVFHASDITAYAWKQGRGIYRSLFERGDLFLPVSRYARARLLELGCPEKKIRVHRMGVDLARFRMATRKRVGSAPLHLLAAARLVEKKGFCYALSAAAVLIKEGIVRQFTIVGDGPLQDELMAQAKKEMVSERICFAGWQESGAVQRYLKNADVFLAPGIPSENGDEDGIPVVLMEAMASCVPVVTTRTGGIRELVEDGKTGFLVSSRDPQALAECLRNVWRDPALVEKVVLDARQRIEQQYDIKRLNDELVKLFSAVAYEKYEE